MSDLKGLRITTKDNASSKAEVVKIFCPDGGIIRLTGDLKLDRNGRTKKQVYLVIDAPKEYKIYREELLKDGKHEN